MGERDAEDLICMVWPVIFPDRPRRGAGDPVSDDEYFAFKQRIDRGWLKRLIADPAANVGMWERHFCDEEAHFTNAALAVSGARFARDPRSSPSISELARVLGVSQPTASGRAKRGTRWLAQLAAAVSVIDFSAARRERDARRAAQAMSADALAPYEARHRTVA